MKALVLDSPDHFAVKEIPTPSIGKDEVLIRVRACAICGTDIRIIKGQKTKDVHYPSVIGHETAGEIAEVGSKIRDYKVGDRVVLAPVIPCMKCTSCIEGNDNICVNRMAFGYQYDGGFAEYVKVPASAIGNIHRIRDEIGFDEAAIVEPLACCVNGQRKLNIRPGEKVFVLGAGPIGLFHIMLAKLSGAAIILVNEPNAERRKKALEFGATYAVDMNDKDLGDYVKKISDGQGMDCGIIAASLAPLINTGLGLLKKGGRINLFAGFNASTAEVSINLIHYNELRISGTSSQKRLDFRDAMNLANYKMIPLKKMVTHVYPLEAFDEAFKIASNGEGLKVVIHPNH